jgi:hypothetical protein
MWWWDYGDRGLRGFSGGSCETGSFRAGAVEGGAMVTSPVTVTVTRPSSGGVYQCTGMGAQVVAPGGM